MSEEPEATRFWREVDARFDPEQTGDPAWWVERDRSPAREVNAQLSLPTGRPQHVLLVGTMGTGKTTELLRAAGLRASREFVVFVDLVRHFREVVGDANALPQVTTWEVCFLVGLAVLRAAEERLGHRFDKRLVKDFEEAWRRTLTRADGQQPPQVDAAKLGKAMVLLASYALGAGPAGLTALGALPDAAKWEIPFGIGRTLRAQDEEVRHLVDCVNRILGDVQASRGRVLVVVDGLDRVSRLDDARRIFREGDILGRLVCALVVSGPFPLRHHPDLYNLPGFDHVVTVFNEPVLDQADPARHGPGVDFFVRLYHKRSDDLGRPSALSEHALRALAWYSGGRARDFVRLIRLVAQHAMRVGAEDADDAVVDAAVDEARRLRESGLHKGHTALLRAVADDPEHELPDAPLTWELLEQNLLLPYPDGSEWFFPHPLLTIRKVRLAPRGSSASSTS